MASTQTRWKIAGDYFENCNCDIVCPCLFSPNAPLTSQPTAGACEIAFGFFTGSVGGPPAALTPLISTVLGVKTVPITFRQEGKRRSVEIPSIMQLAIHAVPSMNPDEEIWAKNAHFIAPSVAMAVGDEKSTWADYGMRWDNAGKNAHYAPINWSNT